MKKKTCAICSFLIAAKGNWRNSLYIECDESKCENKCSGYLMVPDSEGWPILLPVDDVPKITGMSADKSECIAVISRQKFQTLYSSWFDWQASNSEKCLIRQADCKIHTKCDL